MSERDFMKPGRSLSLAENAMAATSHPQATLAALDILRAGGNAVDAAIAAVALQGVIDPHMTGIGGDCFALYCANGAAPVAINGSGRAAHACDPQEFRERGLAEIPDNSADAVTVPGAVDAWCHLSETYGRIGLDAILQPAIRAAETGFTITPRVALDWARYSERLRPYPASVCQFLPAGHAPETGDRLSHPALGASLRKIAKDGRGAFYEGEVAEEIVDVLRNLGSALEISDFHATRTTESPTISANYRGHTLHECPPNGQGIVALIIARILDGFDLDGNQLSEADRIHLLAEATKSAYRQSKLYVADADSMAANVEQFLAEPRIAAIRAAISMEKASAPECLDFPVHRDTVYVTVADSDGNVISLINSLFFAFGSGIYAPKSGVLLQNRGSGFSLEKGHPNELGPGKRPLHTIIPAMVFDGDKPVLSLGVMGGQYQATGHVHILSQIVDRKFDIQAASDQPRSFFTEGAITLEPTIGADVQRDLERRGHATRWADEPLGGYQAIRIDHDRNVLWGASDHRKDGIALGF